MQKVTQQMKGAYLSIPTLLSGRPFFLFIVALFVFQALWLAFSFKYAMLYDESYHFHAIRFFSLSFNPLPVDQPASFDQYGSMIYGNASLYHYILAIPYRLVDTLLPSFSYQIVIFRIINIALAASTLFIYRNLLLKLGVKGSITNISLLVYTLIPRVSLLAATISYDNLLIPLTGLFLLAGVNILQSKREDLLKHAYIFILVGIFGSVVKFTFVPVFIAGLVFVAFRSFIPQKRSYLSAMKHFWQKKSWFVIGCVVVPLILLVGIGAGRYIVPLVQYKTILPSCTMVLGVDRCDKLHYYKQMEQAIHTKDERTAMPIESYAISWIDKMMNRLDTTGIQLPDGPGKFKQEYGERMSILSILMFIGQVIIFFSIVFMLHRNIKNKGWQLVIITGLTLTAVLFMFNASSYYSANFDLNVQSRYLQAYMPLIIALGLMSLDQMIRSKQIKTISFILLLIISTQGGGLVKHIHTSKDGWYWENSVIEGVNVSAKNALDRVVYRD